MESKKHSFTDAKRESDGFHAVFEPLLVRADRHAAAPRDIRIDKSEFRIGRGRENDEIILDTSISRKHCALRKEGSWEWTIQDLSSSCTMLNDIPVARGTRQKISVGDILQFSPDERFRYVFTLTLRDERNPEKQWQNDGERRDAVPLKAEELKHKLETNECEQETSSCKPAVCASGEMQKQEEAAATRDGGETLLRVSAKEKVKQWKEELQNELKGIIESIKEKEKDVQERLPNDKSLVAEECEKSQTKDETSCTANENCIFVDLSEANDPPQLNVLDTIDLTLDATGSPLLPAVAKNTFDTVTNIMDEQLTCGICSELFIEATTLNCKHTFCRHCIDSWNKKRRECPMCRAPVISKNGALALDNFIEQMVENLPNESKEKRKRTIEEREVSERSVRRAKKNKTAKKRV